MIAVINYGLGNARSVMGAIERLGYMSSLTDSPKKLREAEKLILPGVGAFGDGMRRLRGLGLIETLSQLVFEEKRPILGICLGVQLFAKTSCEFGRHEGLGWIDASVERVNPSDMSLRLPHVGWNGLAQIKPSPLFDGIPADALFYYVHSYRLDCYEPDNVVGECEYGQRFTAAIQKDNIYGVQFHPEKSQRHGLRILRNFIEKA